MIDSAIAGPQSSIRIDFAGSSNGRTAAFGAVNRGSNPRPAAMGMTIDNFRLLMEKLVVSQIRRVQQASQSKTGNQES